MRTSNGSSSTGRADGGGHTVHLAARGWIILATVLVLAAAGSLGWLGGEGARGAPKTDGDAAVFDQCANDPSPSVATDCPGSWINGILQSNNSHYAEDQSVPQRLVIDLPAGGPLT